MLQRYTRPPMDQLWSDQQKYANWLEVEILACQAWANLGHIPQEDVDQMRKNARINVDRILEIEEETRHDVVAFTRALSETLGPEKKWVHYGLTSTDVVDTAYGYQLKQVNLHLRQALVHLMEVVAKKANQHRYTVCMGRTHGVHAEPTTFGLKLALWYSELKRDLVRFDQAASDVEAGKISGAVGTFANIPPYVEEFVCQELGLRPQEISTQVLPRDLHAHYVATLALIGTSLEKFATEIRGLQKSETREVEEYFAKGQKGSSAMPHKRNPIGSENITGLARVLRGYVVTANENVTLWHERDISHSSAERIILADATSLLHYMLGRFAGIVENLTVFPDNMLRNMEATYGLIYSQRVLHMLIDKGLSREAAYDMVQPCTAQAWDQATSFRSILEQSSQVMEHLTSQDLDQAFDYSYHLQHVDYIFHRVGLDEV